MAGSELRTTFIPLQSIKYEVNTLVLSVRYITCTVNRTASLLDDHINVKVQVNAIH